MSTVKTDTLDVDTNRSVDKPVNLDLTPSDLPSAEAVEAVCEVASKRSVSPVQANKTRVAVLMSGGVDSSVTAMEMIKAGYDVIGVTGWLIKSGSRCCDTGMVDAARVCEQLGIEHHAVDLREMFKAEIIDQFPQSYARARTPLPCSVCNTLVKWGALLRYSQKILQARYIATGHYARVVETEDGFRLARAKDPRKDQSYVLWGLTMEQLKATLLPLGDFSKDEIRALADQGGLVTANKPDSQDLCFIPRGTTTQQYLGNFLTAEPGPIVHTITAEMLGQHQGTFNYTIGQRKGIGIAYHEPLYVTSIDPDTRTVYVGPPEALLRNELTASAANWLMETPPVEPFEALAKIRYNSKAEPATVYPLPDAQVRVVFHEPQPAITPGQVLGIYDLTDTYILGGGWID
ncbi:MAG: tRNA 2-thiouridine(34) synthase MnmA [Candidatus Melainabacteria bacterium]|nr:tRNA 2-thiouridine(34) synthase MnmA [Candidatus Melainabacteria bacterium]